MLCLICSFEDDMFFLDLEDDDVGKIYTIVEDKEGYFTCLAM